MNDEKDLTTPLTDEDVKKLDEFWESLKRDPNVDQDFLKYREKQMRRDFKNKKPKVKKQIFRKKATKQ